MTRPKPKAPGIRQAMFDLHIWTGLLAGWLLYAMFLTGTVSYFKEELSQWMRPELPPQSVLHDPARVATQMVTLLAQKAPGSPQWDIVLPTARVNVVGASWRNPGAGGRRGFESASFDPATGEVLSARATQGGEFFYRFHFQFHYMSARWGRWLTGLCAMFMLVAIVSGVVTHKKIFTDFFTFRPGKGQRSWLDMHAALAVLGLPFHLMITWSGLILLMFMYMPWNQHAVPPTPAERARFATETSDFLSAGKPAGQPAALAPVADMVRVAQARWGDDNIGRVTVNHPFDAAARVVIVPGDGGRVSKSPRFLVFDGTTGTVVQEQDRTGAAAETRGVLWSLHLGRFADTATRWFYFLVSLAGTAMVGTGLVLWIVKRRAKLPDPARPYFGFRLVERLNIASIAGLSIAMAAFLWGNRLLPTDLAQRGEWEIHLFFILWAASLVHALLRPAKRAWVEQWWIAAGLLLLLPIGNAQTTSRGLFASIAAGDWVFAGMDLTLLALGGLHAVLAVRTANHRPKVRQPSARDRAGRAVSEEAA